MVVDPATVYITSADVTPAFVITLNVFAISYPNAIANAVASSAADVFVAIVPAELGNVKVTSLVEDGPINVTLFVPLSESSKNSIKPAEEDPFLTDILLTH